MLGVLACLLMVWLKIPLGLMWGSWLLQHTVQGWRAWGPALVALCGLVLVFINADLADKAKPIGGKRDER
jgi:hypothetical protein